jgi:hypothetical protein
MMGKGPRTPQPTGALAARKTANAASPAQGAAPRQELVSEAGRFHLRDGARGVLGTPNGTYNFVRLHGAPPAAAQTFLSPRLAHAALAGQRAVSYAGTIRFEQGELSWWSNYSGTYQPDAAFRARAQLPDERFVPWQKLQLGGVAMQRGGFVAREAEKPPAPTRPQQVQPVQQLQPAQPSPDGKARTEAGGATPATGWSTHPAKAAPPARPPKAER